MVRGLFLAAAFALSACGGGTKKCNTNADCTMGQTCDVASGTCKSSSIVGGGGGTTGGGSGGGGGMTGGGGGSTGGGGGMTGGGGGSTGGGGGSDGGVLEGGEVCEQAVAPTVENFSGTTIGKASDYEAARFADGSPCNGYAKHPGADVVYKLTVAARTRVNVTVQGQGGDGTTMATPVFDPAIYIVADPATNCATSTGDGGVQATCIAASEDPFNDETDLLAAETVSWTNYGTTAKDVFLVVESGWDPTSTGVDIDGDGTDDVWTIGEGAFTASVVSTALPPAPANDTCASPASLTPGMPMTTETTAGSAPDMTFADPTTCLDTTGVGDVFYSVMVPPGQRLTVAATAPAAGNIIGLNIFEGACTGVATCKRALSQTAGTAASTFWDNRTMNAMAVMVQVATLNDQQTGTTFTLDTTLANIPPPPANDTCVSPPALTSGTTTNGTTVDALSDLTFAAMTTGCIDTTGRNDVFYTALVPAGNRLTVAATTMASGNTISVNIFEGMCTGVATCKSASSSTAGTAATTFWENRTMTDVTVVVQIATRDAAGAGAVFTVTPTLTVLPPPPVNDTCAAAPALTSGMMESGTTAGAASDLTFGTSPMGCINTTGRNDVFYTAVVPAGNRLTVAASTMATGQTISVNLFEGMCTGVTTCTSNSSSTSATAVWDNRTMAAQTIVVQVATRDTAGLGAAFTLMPTIAVIPPPPANDTCAMPAVLMPNMTTMGTNVSAVADTIFAMGATGCSTTSAKKDVFYSLVVPAGKTATITVTPAGTTDSFINILGSTMMCSGVAACVGGDDTGGDGEDDVATWTNMGTADVTVLVQVGLWYGEEGPFSIQVALTP